MKCIDEKPSQSMIILKSRKKKEFKILFLSFQPSPKTVQKHYRNNKSLSSISLKKFILK